MEGIDTTNWVDFASLLTPPASDISQPCPPAQSNPAAFPQTMAPDPMIFPALDMHFPLYSADPIPGPEIPVAQMVPQQVAEVPSRSGSNASDPTVLTPHDRQEHILSSARAAGYSSFDAAVVDYYTGYYDEGSSVHEAQKASRSTRLRGVLGSLSRSAQRWPSSDVQGYHNEVRRAAEMLCMTDMAKLADTGAPDHCSKSSPMSRKDSGVSGCSDGSEKGLHAAFQDKVSPLLRKVSKQQAPSWTGDFQGCNIIGTLTDRISGSERLGSALPDDAPIRRRRPRDIVTGNLRTAITGLGARYARSGNATDEVIIALDSGLGPVRRVDLTCTGVIKQMHELVCSAQLVVARNGWH